MKWKVARVFEMILGLIFLSAGINGFLVYFGVNPLFPISEPALDFLGTGYLLVLVKSVEFFCGLLLIIGWFIPLTLLITSCLLINILAFHIFVDPSFLPLALFLLVLHSVLLLTYKTSFIPLLKR
ncbi:hypothetical protein [Bacillus alkalicellulosilyticus]|uniref:hypothetical protein n=1 Tax=Alkalihalobacterium alkalicellulosilyticum TaxID=1912214 RepID=UPI000996E368|nr:hypothetical protein [Bacillus alkalicellulosilyticus]